MCTRPVWSTISSESWPVSSAFFVTHVLDKSVLLFPQVSDCAVVVVVVVVGHHMSVGVDELHRLPDALLPLPFQSLRADVMLE